MNRTYVINAMLAAGIVVAAWLLDAFLQLGSFHGLVFVLYSLYGLGAQALVNGALWPIRDNKSHRDVALALPLIIFGTLLVAEVLGGT